jgi:hypothetical protein
MRTLKGIWASRRARVLAGTFLGALGGYLFYRFIGCPTGGCPITSNPWLMVPLGAFFGHSLFIGDRPKAGNQESDTARGNP